MKKLLFLLLVKIHLIAFNQDCDLYALKADMDNHLEFSVLIQEKPELIPAWKFIREAIPLQSGTTKFALDPSTLEKISEMMQPNSTWRNVLEGNWETKLDEILEKHKHLNCVTCGGTFVSGPKMDEFLSDVEHFFNNFNTNGKASKYFNWLNRETAGLGEAADIATNNANTSLAEMYQTLYELRRRGLNEADIDQFGAPYSNLPNSRQSDILLNDGTHIELKNKKYTSGTNPTEQEIDQIIGVKGALGNIDDLSKFEWVAFEARGNNLADLKTMWKDVFVARKNEIFVNMNQDLRIKLLIDSPDDLTLIKIDEILNVIIKVE